MSNFQRGRSYASSGRRNGSSNNQYRGGGNRGGGRGRYRNPGESLNPLIFVKKASGVVEEAYVPINSFADFDLDEKVKIMFQRMALRTQQLFRISLYQRYWKVGIWWVLQILELEKQQPFYCL